MPVRQAIIGASVLMLLSAFFGIFALNALTMVISPRHWFLLPEWIQGSGSLRLRREKYSSGWGAFQVRLLGAIFLAGLFATFFLMMRHPR
jgi:hypothetical protein